MDKKVFIKPEVELIEVERSSDILTCSNGMCNPSDVADDFDTKDFWNN